MPVDRHPSQEERAAYRAGDTSPGTALALSVHAERCAVCRVDIQSHVAPARGREAAPAEPIAGLESHTLSKLRQAPWRWLWPGVRVAEVHGASGLGEGVLLLKLAPGCGCPTRALSALAQVVILGGALRDNGELFLPGDYLHAATRPLRRPVAERPDGCLSLVVTDGSWPGRRLSDLLSLRREEEG